MPDGPAWDAVVVGGGVGGMATATRMAQAGRRIALVEPQPPGAFRVGESLDWEAPIWLRRLGLPVEQWVAHGKATVKGGVVVSAAARPGEPVAIGFSPVYRLLMGLVGRQRATLHVNRQAVDQDLAQATRSAGVVWITTRARRVEIDGDRVHGVVLDDGRCLTGRFYVDATGRAGMFRRAFGIGRRTTGPRKVVVSARFPHRYDGQGTRVRTDDTLTEPAWVWDINVSEALTDIGIVVTEADFALLRRRFPTRRDLFLHQVGKHADLAWLPPLVADETRFWSCVFQDLVAHRSHGENWIAVGEAAFVVDAILATGFTLALRTGFFAARIITEALSHDRATLCPLQRHIYHEKTAAQVTTTNALIDTLWYRGRLRDHYSLALNVLSILAVNFNLNHLHTRCTPRTLRQLRLLLGLHHAIDALAPAYDAWLTRRARGRAPGR